MRSETEIEAMQEATDRVLYWARDLAKYDDDEPVRGVFSAMQFVAQALAGLKAAVEHYDKTIAYFERDA